MQTYTRFIPKVIKDLDFSKITEWNPADIGTENTYVSVEWIGPSKWKVSVYPKDPDVIDKDLLLELMYDLPDEVKILLIRFRDIKEVTEDVLDIYKRMLNNELIDLISIIKPELLKNVLNIYVSPDKLTFVGPPEDLTNLKLFMEENGYLVDLVDYIEPYSELIAITAKLNTVIAESFSIGLRPQNSYKLDFLAFVETFHKIPSEIEELPIEEINKHCRFEFDREKYDVKIWNVFYHKQIFIELNKKLYREI